jgi:hypothetical protein
MHAWHVAFQVPVEGMQPDSSDSVVPGASALMNDCWEADLDDRVTSAEICNVDFQVICNVDSGKLAKFVQGIQKSEKQHASE